MLYQLGTFVFVTLEGPGGRGSAPPILREEQSLIVRPGADGLNVRREGKRGRPFQMRSTAVYATSELALLAVAAYHNVVGQAATLTWDNANFTLLFGTAYQILEVSPQNIVKLGAGVWQTTNISGYWKVEADWTLLAVDAADVIPSG